MNYFEFYDIPVKFNIDENALKAKFYKIAKENHPDFFVNDEEKYNTVLQISSLNNEAFKCLSDYYSRVEYVLKLSNKIFDEKLSPVFLIEMMDMNEAIEEVKANNDLVKNQQLISEIESMKEYLASELKNLTTIADNTISIEKKPLKEIKENLQKHKYILRLKETLANIAAR